MGFDEGVARVRDRYTVYGLRERSKLLIKRSSALDSSSGVVRMWVRIPVWPVAALVSLSKTLNHKSFGWDVKLVGPVCCVMHVKKTRTLIVKLRRGLPGI